MSDTPDTVTNLVRVEKGEASHEELAAVTALLLTRAAAGAPADEAGPGRSRASWRRLDRTTGFRSPHSWQG